MHHSSLLRRSIAVFAALAVGGAVALVATSGANASSTAADQTSAVAAMAMAPGRGENDFGMTKANFRGHRLSFTYTHGYFCDTSVSAGSSSKCEVGQKWRHAPSAQHDPLFITVPLGFSPGRMTECPTNLTCVDHPMTVDLSRLEPALKPLYPQYTDAQLTAALKNFATPQHDHFIADKNHGKAEWWDVYVVGVTSPKTFSKIHKHASYAYIHKLIKHKNPHVVGPIPSNLFLYFGVHK
jgi:hypothetical protein